MRKLFAVGRQGIAAILAFAAIPPGIAVGQATSQAPPPPPDIDWTEQVATLTSDGDERFRVFARDKYSCEIAFYQDGVTPGFVLYQIPDVPPSMSVYAPADWMEFDGEQKFTIISTRITGEGDDANVQLEINQMPFKRIEDDDDGTRLGARPSGFTYESLNGSIYMSFGAAPETGEEDGKGGESGAAADADAEPAPILEYTYKADHSSQAAQIFSYCQDWIRQQPEWQRDFGPQ